MSDTAIIRHARVINLTVLITALGYFVDVYDMIIFLVLRRNSLMDLGLSGDALTDVGLHIINLQMIGLILGGLIFGVMGDKIGRKKCLLGSILLYSLATLACAFVQDVDHYAWLRFIAGIGLAGEVGIGVSLIAETMPQKNRGLGVTLFGFIGIGGAVVAGLAAEWLDWRTCYLVGGIAGLLLLITRSVLMESRLFEHAQQSGIERGNIFRLIKEPKLGLRYLCCILIGMPIMFVIGMVWTLGPEIGKAMNIPFEIKASLALAIGYTGMMCGDVLAGVLTQMLKSRRKGVAVFLMVAAVSIAFFVTRTELSLFEYYVFCGWLGVTIGYWVNLITIAAEQFGTNLRATVAASVPNLARATLVPMNLLLANLKPTYGIMTSISMIAIMAVVVALLALSQLRETFYDDMNYHS
jgi:putative MFS transporter